MIVKRLTFDHYLDIDQLIVLGCEFAESRGFRPDHEHMANQVRAINAAGIGAFWAMIDGSEHMHGALGAIVAPSLWNGEIEASELFWFVREQYRGSPSSIRLVLELEDWAMKVGAKRIRMATFNGELDKMYARMNYKEQETFYIKDISWQQPQQ